MTAPTAPARPATDGRSAVNARLTPGTRARARRMVDNTDYTAFLTRAIRANGRRVADGDVDALPALVALSGELDTAISHAVTGLRAYGYSWAEIATRLGITRQAAQQRWSQPVTETLPPA